MKESFTTKLKLRNKNKALLEVVSSIINEYTAAGYALTVRQLYYQLVSRDIIANKVSEYFKVSKVLKQGRMSGIIDWDAIEDRTRIPQLPYYCDDIPSAIRDIINAYRLDRQLGQKNYIEILVEKDALSGVLGRVTRHYHIRLLVNRGYTSCTAMYRSHQRIKERFDAGQKIVLLYVGDHDPSGLDMVRDVEKRLADFGVNELKIVHVALTQAQIKKYSPPPNPAKIKDPRAKWYFKEFGNTSWEVDALRPEVLDELINRNVENHIDMKMFEAMLEKEKLHKGNLKRLLDTSSLRNSIVEMSKELKKDKQLIKLKKNKALIKVSKTLKEVNEILSFE